MTVTPTRIAARNTPEGQPIIWGAALLDAGGYTYIYGWGGKDNTHSRLYLARSAPADVGNPARWAYSKGGDIWSPLGALAEAAPVSSDRNLSVEAGFSVSLIEGAYWLIQHDGRVYGAGPIVGHPAAQPWGFTGKRVVFYSAPELPYAAANKYQVVYEARAHDGLSTSGAVVSYNVNTNSASVGNRSRIEHDASTYRPRFINVPGNLFNSAAAGTPPPASHRPPPRPGGESLP